MTEIVWKILTASETIELIRSGLFEGSEDDLRDGFIHLSAHDQVSGTLHKHFSNQTALYLLQCKAETMENSLVWEKSRSGALFPHLYRALMLGDIIAVRPIAATEWSAHLSRV